MSSFTDMIHSTPRTPIRVQPDVPPSFIFSPMRPEPLIGYLCSTYVIVTIFDYHCIHRLLGFSPCLIFSASSLAISCANLRRYARLTSSRPACDPLPLPTRFHNTRSPKRQMIIPMIMAMGKPKKGNPLGITCVIFAAASLRVLSLPCESNALFATWRSTTCPNSENPIITVSPLSPPFVNGHYHESQD